MPDHTNLEQLHNDQEIVIPQINLVPRPHTLGNQLYRLIARDNIVIPDRRPNRKLEPPCQHTTLATHISCQHSRRTFRG